MAARMKPQRWGHFAGIEWLVDSEAFLRGWFGQALTPLRAVPHQFKRRDELVWFCRQYDTQTEPRHE